MRLLSPFLASFLLLLVTSNSSLAQAPPYHVVKGTVLDEKGATVSGVFVCAFSPSGPGSTDCAYSRRDGSFQLASRRTGDFRLVGEKRSEGYISSYLPFFRHPTIGPTAVSFGGATPSEPVVVRLPPKNGFLVGEVMDSSTGLPIDDVRFRLCHAGKPSVCHSMVSKSADGRFRLPAPHVGFSVDVSAKQYENWRTKVGGDVVVAVPSGGESSRITISLNRKAAYVGLALHESEKRQGVHLPAPIQIGPEDMERIDRFPRSTKLEWEAVPGAQSYFVEVDYCNGREPASRGCVDPQPFRPGNISAEPASATYSYEFNFVGAQPGRWRVVALDAKGVEGFKSPWRLVFYTH